jgi:type II secretory ATPase GspE/PulE/Tfp pilus assembly ATPase PilB-like protein
MPDSLAQRFQQQLPQRDVDDPQYVPELVDALLAGAREAGASDVHLLPTAEALRMSWRIDGVLQPVAELPVRLAPNIVGRLKVLADLLTYQTEVPQEGRLRAGNEQLETRISTFPTLYGEKAVVRLFVGSGKYRRLDELGLPDEVLGRLKALLHETGGVILLTGPAGSGKTTTIYACLREILNKSAGARCLVSLEDPIEVVVPGVAQSQINRSAAFTMAAGLRSLLRQDPEVIMVGEIRDRDTAETVFQASLTGHLVLTTFHAGSAAQAVSRLADMRIEPYLLRSGLLAIVCQRLVRKLCACTQETRDIDARLGLPVESVRLPQGCPACEGTGYQGRMVLCEMLYPNVPEVARAILECADAARLEQTAVDCGTITQRARAYQAVRDGLTSPAEVLRVLGVSRSPQT